MTFLEEVGKWRLYANDLVLFVESEEDVWAMVGRFVEVCRGRGLKVNADKSKVIVLNVEEGLECEVVYMFRKFNTWDMFWMNQVHMRQSVVGRWRVVGGLQALLGLWLMLGVCSLIVLRSCMSHCS